MKYIFLFAQFIIVAFSKRVISTYNVPSCKNCLHFKRSTSFPSFSHMAYCTRFDTENAVGVVKHDRALNCRTDENKCGIGGRAFYSRKSYENVFNHIVIPRIQKKITLMLFVSFLIIRSIFS